MNIELNNNDTLKVILDRKDMNRLNITFAEMDYENRQTREILKIILSEASKLTGFTTKTHKLLIEAFPAPDGGCLLYFTKLTPKRPIISEVSEVKIKDANHGLNSYIFEFSQIDDMLYCADFICMQQTYPAPQKSALYVCGEAYRLILDWTISKKDAQNIICEFGRYKGQGDHAVALTKEHWKLVSEDDVLRKIARKAN